MDSQNLNNQYQSQSNHKGGLSSGLGIASLILGIIGFLTAFIVIGILFDIIAIILGIIAIANKNQKSGLGIAGLIIASVSIIIMIFFGAMFSDSSSSTPKPEATVTSAKPEAAADTGNETSTAPLPTQSQSSEQLTCGLGETWTVDGQWTLTINSITETSERNEFSEKTPAQVFIIDYTYENLGYEDESGIMDGLYFDLTSGQIVDSNGYMGYSYPGTIQNYAQETPTGAKCAAQECIAVDNQSTELKLILSKYDGTGSEQNVTFILPVN